MSAILKIGDVTQTQSQKSNPCLHKFPHSDYWLNFVIHDHNTFGVIFFMNVFIGILLISFLLMKALYLVMSSILKIGEVPQIQSHHRSPYFHTFPHSDYWSNLINN